MDRAGNLVVLYAFSGADGAYPTVPLIQASDGYFYGTTSGGVSVHESANLPLRAGMSSSLGTVFRIDSSGNLTTLHSFRGRDGASPNASLLQGSDGFLYGTTSGGGSAGMGTVFRLDTAGNFTVLHSFAGPDGDDPVAGLIQATDGSFYGTTWTGGNLTCSIDYDFQNYPFPFNLGCGTVFRMDQSGNVTVLHAFEFAPTDGSGPAAGVVQGSDGNLYGTTFYGGNVFFGVVFRIDPSALLPSALPKGRSRFKGPLTSMDESDERANHSQCEVNHDSRFKSALTVLALSCVGSLVPPAAQATPNNKQLEEALKAKYDSQKPA